MKNIRLKLLFAVLVMFSFTFFMSIEGTKAIYHEVETTTIDLTVISSSDYLVTFNSDGGTSVPDRYVAPNAAVGTLPIPTKANANFAGWYDSNNQRVRHDTLITANTNLHAVWSDIVCKLVTEENELHQETCLSGGCRINNNTGFNVNDPITYGNIGDGVPNAGDAYNCDVDYDSNYDIQEPGDTRFTERFYFVREKVNSSSPNNAVLVYYTSVDANGRANRSSSKTDIESYNYTTALTYLPTNQNGSNPQWDNPLLIDFDGNGTTSRFLSFEDYEPVCGNPVVTESVACFTD